MSRTWIGWAFVAVQFALLAALVLLPGGDDWPRPAVLRYLGLGAIVGGVAIVAVASRWLGPGLTPTPVPTSAGRLVTAGPFKLVRHPIYSGVLLAVVGVAIRSGSSMVVVVALVTVAFFYVKSSWEEARLRETYPDYRAYARSTGRFVPRLPTGRGTP